jgi:hypothetical protein
MAVIQRPIKTYGTRSYASEVALAPGNEDPILANEVDADFDTIYAAWNTPANRADWVTSGASAITPVDPTKTLLCAPVAEAVQWGLPGSIKHRVSTWANGSQLSINTNASDVQDDATKPGWAAGLDIGVDAFFIARTAPGAAPASYFTVQGDGKTHCTLANSSVTAAMIAPGATIRSGGNVVIGAFSTPGINTWYNITNAYVTLAAANEPVLLTSCIPLVYYGTGNVWIRITRAGVNVIQQLFKYSGAGPGGPVPGCSVIDASAPAGSVMYTFDVQVSQGAVATDTASINNGLVGAWVLS